MLHRKTFGLLLLVKTKVSNFIAKSLKLAPLLCMCHDDPARIVSGEASSDELVMQNSVRMRKYDRACAMQSCSKSMSYKPALIGYNNATIYDYYLLFRCSAELSTIAKAN